MLASAAEQSLKKLNDPRAVPALLEVLATGGEKARFAAARLLGHLGGAEAAPGLIRALDDPDSLMQSYAAEALGRIGATQAIPHLLAKLRGTSSTAIISARALRLLGSRHGVPDEVAGPAVSDTWLRSKAAEVLGILETRRPCRPCCMRWLTNNPLCALQPPRDCRAGRAWRGGCPPGGRTGTAADTEGRRMDGAPGCC